MPLSKVQAFVQQYDSSLQPLIFEQGLHTSQEAADALGVEIGQIAKSILFKTKTGFALFVASGDVRINTKRVKQLLGSTPKMASSQEVKEVTGFIVGAVCPFALSQPTPIYIDETLARFEVIYTAAGIPESLLPIRFEQLIEITSGVVTNVTDSE